MSEAELREKFRPFGKIKKGYIVKDSPPKLYGIVRYHNPDSAAKAVEGMHEKSCASSTWYVALCERKSERNVIAKRMLRQIATESQNKNLFLRGFPESWTEENLKAIFAKYGQITSAKIKGITAFVCFDSKEAAKAALDAEKALTVDGVRVYITLWQMKSTLTRRINKTKAKRNSSRLGLGSERGGRGGRRGMRGVSSERDESERDESASEVKESPSNPDPWS
jgi:polyadenylate-binding protein